MKETTWFSGYWDVTTFERDGRDVPAVITDATRWRRIKLEAYEDKVLVRWHLMDDSYGDLYDVAIDEQAHTMTFTPNTDYGALEHPTGPIVFAYARIDATHLALAGKVGGEAIAVRLQRFEPEQMLLVTRGFHWISEKPFNR